MPIAGRPKFYWRPVGRTWSLSTVQSYNASPDYRVAEELQSLITEIESEIDEHRA